MVYGAIDLHMRYSWIRIIDADGIVQREQRVPTSRERLVQAFEGLGVMRILLETGTESEWVAEVLEGAGHEVVVADPNFAPMYGERRRTIKTDRRDVAALAEANRRMWYRATHRVSGEQRAIRRILRSRRQLVQMRYGHTVVDSIAGSTSGVSRESQRRARTAEVCRPTRAAGPAR